ncbi:MAG: ABC transporter substrate-binding protein, partial [Beijerinckiaceae bacterium]|nr:ABC transporter substrate-binding protein [Beijerinckiaceae bacterium]
TMALGNSLTPGDSLKTVFGSKAAATPGSRNLGGITNPAVDALIDKIARAETRPDLVNACKALDRVLRSERYWIPMWFNDKVWLAYWDLFSRPERTPKFGSGAPGTWWWDEAKAAKTLEG